MTERTINFRDILTEQAAENVLAVIKKENRQAIKYGSQIDVQTFTHEIFFFAAMDNEDLSTSLKYRLKGEREFVEKYWTIFTNGYVQGRTPFRKSLIDKSVQVMSALPPMNDEQKYTTMTTNPGILDLSKLQEVK